MNFYLPTNAVTVIFGFLIIGALWLLWVWQRRKDNFDLRDALTSPGTDGVRRVDTSKTLLVGVFLVSSYLVSDNYSDTALGVYLGAWVINGGAVLAYKAWKGNGTQPTGAANGNIQGKSGEPVGQTAGPG